MQKKTKIRMSSSSSASAISVENMATERQIVGEIAIKQMKTETTARIK